ncbi:MAG: hypothetical protein H0U57_00065 [Tatlockia sp.]|nr:hypothetical protein [Tatlockia sp.]
MSKPILVEVLTSESEQFTKNELNYFVDLEAKAYKVAIDHDLDGRYYKTKIKVYFDEGETYERRLALAPLEALGFEHHVCMLMDWYERRDKDKNHSAILYKANYEFLKQVVYPVSQ